MTHSSWVNNQLAAVHFPSPTTAASLIMLVSGCQQTCRHRHRPDVTAPEARPFCPSVENLDRKMIRVTQLHFVFYLYHSSASVTLSDSKMCWPFTDVHSPWQPTPLRGVQAFYVKQETLRMAVVPSTLTSTSLKRNPLVWSFYYCAL